MRGCSRDETFWGGRHQQRQSGPRSRRVVTATQQINFRRLRRGRLFRRFDVNMSEAAFAFELAQVVNGVFLGRAEDGQTVSTRWACFKLENEPGSLFLPLNKPIADL